MSDASVNQVVALATDLSGVLERVYSDLTATARTLSEIPLRESGGWLESDLSPISADVLPVLDGDPVFAGMGFVAAPSVVSDLERFMLWWQRNEDRTSRLKLNFDRTSIDVYDYLEMEWFQLAAAGKQRVAMGPYVDYSGSELYIVTATVPVVIEGRFVGVVGADLHFAELERRFVNLMKKAPFDAVMVSAERRVIAANSPRWVPGTRLPEIPGPGRGADGVNWRVVEPLAVGTGWLLAV